MKNLVTNIFKKSFYSFYESFCNLVNHDGIEISGYLAFLMILSIFPCAIFFTKLITILYYFVDEQELLDSLVKTLNSFEKLPIRQIKDELTDILTGPSRILINIAIIGIVWTASSTTQALKYAMNKAYGTTQSSPYILTRLYSILQFMLVSSVTIMITSLLQFLPRIVNYINENFANNYLRSFDTKILQYLENYNDSFNLVLLFIYIIWINIMLPNKKLRISEVCIGSLFTLVGWIISSEILMIYFTKFLQFSIIYGSLAKIVSVLIYFYVISIFFIWGAELNSLLLLQKEKKLSVSGLEKFNTSI